MFTISGLKLLAGGTLKVVTPTLETCCVYYSVLCILFGYYPAERTTRLFNYYILLGKRYIFVQRLEQKTFSLPQFLDIVKNKTIVQRAIAQSKFQMSKFYSVWKPFLSLLENE